ncbi:MAG: hypothetical protein ACKOSO_08875 [Actinomycetota bacterium]
MACPRGFLRRALADLEAATGLRVRAAFEQEFLLPTDDEPAPPFSLEALRRILTLTGYVNSAPGFGDQPRVINAATELLVDVFGDGGLCARAAIGCQGLALDSSVELVLSCQFDGGDVRPALPTPSTRL